MIEKKELETKREDFNRNKSLKSLRKDFVERIKHCFPGLIKKIIVSLDQIEVQVEKEDINKIIKLFKESSIVKATMLLDIVCVDCLNIEENKLGRYKMIYVLNSMSNYIRIHVSTFVENNGIIESMSNNYESAVWLEREIWDMFGVYFTNHPDLRRILTDYGFSWFPLKKDFPTTGYIEVYYDIYDKKISYKEIELMQEYRNYNFGLSWGNHERKVYLENIIND